MSKVSKYSAPQPPPAPRELQSSPAPEKKNVAAPAQNAPAPARASADGFDAPKKAGSGRQVALETPASVPTARQSFGTNQAQQVAQASGPGEDGKLTVRVDTGTTELIPDSGIQVRNFIQIRVTPLDLGIPPGELNAELDRAMAEKLADDTNTYGADMAAAGHESLEAWSRADGYYGSAAHVAWAEAASARTGGQIPASWWMKFDPFGGTAGNGPHYRDTPGGQYPGLTSRIAMAHDTDWDLGRYFGAGPLEALRGAPNPQDLGNYGLLPLQGVDMYTNGHPDWEVTYGREALPFGTPPTQIA